MSLPFNYGIEGLFPDRKMNHVTDDNMPRLVTGTTIVLIRALSSLISTLTNDTFDRLTLIPNPVRETTNGACEWGTLIKGHSNNTHTGLDCTKT